ncbi:amidohydrolase [Meiothermus sp. CFH 77666]|uniref:amidohydrolase n=1 Tax=Meiothermus sp. CFH 77666 TaxID=2817942 RepID=UPI001AA08116|nr:amidohydrolase [Meiothermus sp. CFH 77666]MBO1436155.1 amidohydrolase [Meiothermus sp. CFH 77666]
MSELLFHGGAILNPRLKGARYALEPLEALLVRRGRIAATGRLSDLESLAPSAQKVHLEGHLLLPGFNDAHVHIWKVGQLRTTLLDLRGVASLAELYARVEERARMLKPGEWLWGRGWNEALLAEKAMPSRAALDRLAPQNPVLLTRTCAHIHAVNSQALELAGITPETHVPGGEIHYDQGILYETAYGLAFKAMGEPSQAQYELWVKAGCEYLRSLGITSATDPAVDPPLYAAYKALDERGELPIRVNLLYMRRPDGGTETFPLPEKHVSDYLRCDSVKFFADGGLSGATAAISRPYKTLEPPQYGILRFEDDHLFELALEAHQAGFRIGTHAIGDRALDQVLRVYQGLYQTAPGPRHRLEHFGLAGPEHLAKAKQLGIIAVPQPVFLRELRANYERYVPDEWFCRCFNLRAMFEAGLTVAFSSDGPVVRQVEPLNGLQAALFEPLCPGNQVSLEQAIWAYTMGGAVAQGDEGNRGSLEVDKWADFVLLEGDLHEAQSLRVAGTIVAGVIHA